MIKIEKDSFLAVMGNPFVLGSLTVFCYLISYQYQQGYLDFFGIPNQLVTLDLSNIIGSIVISFVTLLFTFQILFKVDSINFKNNNYTHELLWFCYSVLSPFYFIKVFGNTIHWRIKVLIVIFIILFPICSLLYRWSERFKSFIKFFIPSSDSSFLLKNFGFSLTTLSVYLLAIYILIHSFYQIGYYKAYTKVFFEIANIGNEDYIVVSYYKNNFVLLPFDKDNNVIKKDVYFNTIEDFSNNNGYLTRERIVDYSFE